MVTDPPYGVHYDPSWRNQVGAAKTKRTGKVLNDNRADWREACALFPGDVAYVWHGALHAPSSALSGHSRCADCSRESEPTVTNRIPPPGQDGGVKNDGVQERIA